MKWISAVNEECVDAVGGEASFVWADVNRVENIGGLGRQGTAVVVIGCAEGWVMHYPY